MGRGLNSLAVCLFWWMNDKRCKILWFWRDFMSFKEAVLAAASRWAVRCLDDSADVRAQGRGELYLECFPLTNPCINFGYSDLAHLQSFQGSAGVIIDCIFRVS